MAGCAGAAGAAAGAPGAAGGAACAQAAPHIAADVRKPAHRNAADRLKLDWFILSSLGACASRARNRLALTGVRRAIFLVVGVALELVDADSDWLNRFIICDAMSRQPKISGS